MTTLSGHLALWLPLFAVFDHHPVFALDDAVVAGRLERAGVIEDALVFRLGVHALGAARALRANVLAQVEATQHAFLSIDLGGTLVLAGDDAAIDHLRKTLPPIDGNPPPVLPRHAAFHTSLLRDIAATAQNRLPSSLFDSPSIPLIDGCGKIWSPNTSDRDALHRYTLDTQITTMYDFAKSLEVALKEFAPDRLILLGPGSSLGAPIGQCLIAHQWRGLQSRDDFMASQADKPFLIAMGREGQRGLAV